MHHRSLLVRATVVLACLALLGPAAPATAQVPYEGPFVGVVQQDRVNDHPFSNEWPASGCITVIATHTVTLRYAPAEETLTLEVTARHVQGRVTGVDGFARYSFEDDFCTQFLITVQGTHVETASAYVIDVSSRWSLQSFITRRSSRLPPARS